MENAHQTIKEVYDKTKLAIIKKMKKYIKIIQIIIPEFKFKDVKHTFREIGIDSMDLVVLRVTLEKKITHVIPDYIWLNFTNFLEIIQYCQSIETEEFQESSQQNDIKFEKETSIDMPQMAVEALSENWLFKELGSNHWDMICKGLNSKSFDLKDDLENRLYATFVRIKIHCSKTLRDFKENEKITFNGKIGRYGNSMYYSQININGSSTTIDAELLTSFSIRNEEDNSKLVKSQPKLGKNLVFEHESIPTFANEYRLIKKGELNEVNTGGIPFVLEKDTLFETTYTINPYYDINGVGLLYFAAYPIINDFCEAQYFNQKNDQRWEQSYYTVLKDIFYFSNCNIDDEIIYKLNSVERIEGNQIKLHSTLFRKSDNQCLAKILSIKGQKQ